MKTYREVDVYIQVFLTPALVEGEWSSSRHGRFIPGERAPGTHSIGGWVGPRTGLDESEREKTSCPYRDSKYDLSVVQPIDSCYTGYAKSLSKIYSYFQEVGEDGNRSQLIISLGTVKFQQVVYPLQMIQGAVNIP
jgi:hypothetical protein